MGREGQDTSLRILGIESSCDETAAAVVEDGPPRTLIVVASQIDTHGKYGGVCRNWLRVSTSGPSCPW